MFLVSNSTVFLACCTVVVNSGLCSSDGESEGVVDDVPDVILNQNFNCQHWKHTQRHISIADYSLFTFKIVNLFGSFFQLIYIFCFVIGAICEIDWKTKKNRRFLWVTLILKDQFELVGTRPIACLPPGNANDILASIITLPRPSSLLSEHPRESSFTTESAIDGICFSFSTHCLFTVGQRCTHANVSPSRFTSNKAFDINIFLVCLLLC